MKTNSKQVQWLVFWLMVCLPFAIMAAASTNTPAAASAPALFATVQNIPSTEPEFETLRDAESIEDQIITALAQDARGLIWTDTPTVLGCDDDLIILLHGGPSVNQSAGAQ